MKSQFKMNASIFRLVYAISSIYAICGIITLMQFSILIKVEEPDHVSDPNSNTYFSPKVTTTYSKNIYYDK